MISKRQNPNLHNAHLHWWDIYLEAEAASSRSFTFLLDNLDLTISSSLVKVSFSSCKSLQCALNDKFCMYKLKTCLWRGLLLLIIFLALCIVGAHIWRCSAQDSLRYLFCCLTVTTSILACFNNLFNSLNFTKSFSWGNSLSCTEYVGGETSCCVSSSFGGSGEASCVC